MGTNTISIFPGRGFGDRRSGRIKTLTINDAKAISQQSYVASATPQTNSNGTLTYRNTDLTASLYGVGEQYFDVRGLKLEEGRLFDDDDVKPMHKSSLSTKTPKPNSSAKASIL